MGREMANNTVMITINPEGKTIPNIPWTEGMNVQQAMELAYSIPPGMNFALQYYGPYGYMVIMIDGTSDASPNYWFLYVNGVLSQTGIDSTILNSGDVVGFTYEEYEEQKHVGDIYRARVEFNSKQ